MATRRRHAGGAIATIPSKQRLLNAFPGLTETGAVFIRALAKARDDVDQLRALVESGAIPITEGQVWAMNQSHDQPYESRAGRETVVMMGISEALLGILKVKSLPGFQHPDWHHPWEGDDFEYVHVFNPDDPTLFHDKHADSLMISTWENVVRRNERKWRG